jgi:CarD family transcriptional regulator
MYNVNDVVMYGALGICKVTAIEKRDLTGEEQEYYILKHINAEKNVYYVPTNNEAALSNMHTICSKAEVNALICNMESEKLIWIENDIKRKEEYSRIIKNADKHELIGLIKTLYLRRKALAETGKKLRSADENFLSVAENMLFEEFAYALDIDRSEVVDYIEKHIA